MYTHAYPCTNFTKGRLRNHDQHRPNVKSRISGPTADSNSCTGTPALCKATAQVSPHTPPPITATWNPFLVSGSAMMLYGADCYPTVGIYGVLPRCRGAYIRPVMLAYSRSKNELGLHENLGSYRAHTRLRVGRAVSQYRHAERCGHQPEGVLCSDAEEDVPKKRPASGVRTC